jgi:uncharacterized membrane protein YedE/YeeE
MTLERCPWYVAGPLLGLLILALRLAVNRPFGALGGYIELAESRGATSRLGMRAFALAGLVLGGALFAITLGSFSPSLAYGGGAVPLPATPLARVAVLVGAGALMGFGARTAGGCTSGHGMSGMSLASPASIASSMTFFATAVGLAHVFAFFFGGAR